jgi:hypothetical protein
MAGTGVRGLCVFFAQKETHKKETPPREFLTSFNPCRQNRSGCTVWRMERRAKKKKADGEES